MDKPRRRALPFDRTPAFPPRGNRSMARFDDSFSRRDAVKIGLGAGFALGLGRLPAFTLPPSQGGPLIQRAIPSSGELLPVVGIGTARNYENPDAEAMARLKS